MKLFSLLFWGIFLVAAGAILLIKYAFNLQFNAGRLVFGLFVALIGVSLLTGHAGWGDFSYKDGNTIVFSGGEDVNAKAGNEYSVVFGSADYDLSGLEPGAKVKIQCAFGNCKIKLPPGAADVTANSVFSTVNLPNGNLIFGNKTYNKPGDNDAVSVDVSCAFGNVTVKE